jgi:probable F420-dependent oxidoreductase
MDISVRIPHTGTQATPEFIREWCSTADDAGYGSVWGSDHLVLPHHTDSLYTLARSPAKIGDGDLSALLAPNFELTTTMAFVAACTKRINIGSGVAVLPIRNAVLNARQLATVDRYSGGRVLYGAGVGWLKEEADAMNMPWDRRGVRTDEHIALLRTIWTAPGEKVEFHGEFWDIPPMDPEPRPVQRPIPILIGGHSEAAIDRAGRLGDGWMAAAMSFGRLQEHLGRVRDAARRYDRDPASLMIHCSGGKPDSTIDDLRRYEELGVGINTLDDLKRFADEVLPKLK